MNRRRSVSGIIRTILGVAVCWKVRIQPAVVSDSTDKEIRCMYKYVRKTRAIQILMQAWSLHTGAPTVYCKYNTSFIYVVEAKRINPRGKHIDIIVCFLQ